MIHRYYPTQEDIDHRIIRLINEIEKNHKKKKNIILYPVPRGGVPVAYLIQKYRPKWRITYTAPDPKKNKECIVIDDIIDSGKTREYYTSFSFYALYDKINSKLDIQLGWIVFPWERVSDDAETVQNNIVRLLEFIGEDVTREGLIETPNRVIKSFKELYSGYGLDVKDYFKIFDVKYDELVLIKDIELYSTCEHHMLPFVGKAHIAYIADGKVIGASKLARILEVYSRRLQVQERIGDQVVTAIMEYLKPKGAACIIEAKHFCMCSRGINKQNSTMVTSSMKGVFLHNPSARAELLGLIR